MAPSQAQDNFNAALARCRSLGMRLSPQRRAILELLYHSHDHLSAGSIYQQLSQAGQPIGYSSVYQNLEALAHRAFIEVQRGPQGNRYGWRPDPHHHFHCTHCDLILDIDLADPLPVEVPSQFMGRVDRAQVDLYGLCERCVGMEACN